MNIQTVNTCYPWLHLVPASSDKSGRFVILWSAWDKFHEPAGEWPEQKWRGRTENKQYFYHPVLKHIRLFGSFSMTKKYNFAMHIPCDWAWTSAFKFYEIARSKYRTSGLVTTSASGK